MSNSSASSTTAESMPSTYPLESATSVVVSPEPAENGVVSPEVETFGDMLPEVATTGHMSSQEATRIVMTPGSATSEAAYVTSPTGVALSSDGKYI
jgi:hypothetical protein